MKLIQLSVEKGEIKRNLMFHYKAMLDYRVAEKKDKLGCYILLNSIYETIIEIEWIIYYKVDINRCSFQRVKIQ